MAAYSTFESVESRRTKNKKEEGDDEKGGGGGGGEGGGGEGGGGEGEGEGEGEGGGGARWWFRRGSNDQRPMFGSPTICVVNPPFPTRRTLISIPKLEKGYSAHP